MLLDDADRALDRYVRPSDWQNPQPAKIYDLVVIGGGTAGLVCAAGAAGLGARVALIEEGRLGGDCLNTGCVPSKALLRAARAVHEARSGGAVGVHADPVVDFSAVMAHVRGSRIALASNDSAERFASLGVDVFFGRGAFADARTVLVGDQPLRFRRAVIATGSRVAVPPVPGIEEVNYLTTDTLFSLTTLPRTLVIFGGGAVGCEMAQAFALLGTVVTLFETEPRVLPNEDPDAASILSRALQRSGVTVVTDAAIASVSAASAGISIATPSMTTTAERLLVATGRVPVIDTLKVSAAGVRTEAGTLVVDDRLRTTNRRVFAAGDVCSRFRFTHAADAMARIVIQNALFFGRKQVATLVIPWCTFTFPEVAHVGADTSARGDADGEILTVPFADVDRAVVDDETEGFVRIRHHQGIILGATIVGPHAAELITFVAHVMRTRGSIGDLSAAIVPYPSAADALRKAGDAYRRRSLTPTVRAVLRRYFSLLRR